MPKYIHKFSKRLVICLSQTSQGSQGHAMRSVSCILCIEAFNEGVEAVYGPRWESTIYQVNVAPLRDIGKTRHRIMSSLVYRFAWVRKASKCSSGFVVSSYRSKLSGFYPKGMSASIMWWTKWCRWVVRPTGQCMWERLKSSVVLIVHWWCDFAWMRLGNVWVECFSPWGHLIWASSWSWSAFCFLISSLWHHSI